MQSKDKNAQNLRACIEMADIRIDNSGTIEDLNKQISELWKTINKK